MGQEPAFNGADKRRSKRSRVLLTARIKTSSGALHVRLRNISQAGALLLSEAVPSAGEDVTFERAETVANAKVVWSEEGRFGIEFLTPIDEAELLRHVQPPHLTGHEYPPRWLSVPPDEDLGEPPPGEAE